MKKFITSLFALGSLAAGIACNSPVSPTPYPTRAPPLSTRTSISIPTATSLPLSAPTETPVKSTMQLKTPTATLVPTRTPTATPTPYQGISFESFLIRQEDCDTIVALKGFSRFPNTNREGWDKVEGSLLYYAFPECYDDGFSWIGVDFNEKFRDNIYGIGPFDFRYPSKRIADGYTKFRTWVNITAVWENGGKAILTNKGGYIEALSSMKIDFSFDIPKIAKDLKFSYDFYPSTDREASEINYYADSPQQATKDLASFKSSLVKGSTYLTPIDPNVYVSWFNMQSAKAGIPAVISKHPALFTDLKVNSSSTVKSQSGVEIQLEVSNKTTTNDVTLSHDFKPKYALAADGSIIFTYPENARFTPFTFDRKVLPPGYGSKGGVDISLPLQIPNVKYIVGTLRQERPNVYSDVIIPVN